MSVKDILVAAFNKDASSFETAFSSVMKEKVSAAVENKFFAAEEYELDESKYEDEEDEDDEEEDEELDEAKKPNQYIGVHDNDSLVKHFGYDTAIDARHTSPNMMFRKGKDGKDYALTKVNNRGHYEATPSSVKKEEALEEKKLSDKDIKRALASAKAKPKETVSLKKPPFKMDEEAEQIDELSKKTLGSYRTKAARDDKDRSKGRNISSAKMYPDQYKNSPLKAKVSATEETDLDEAAKKDWDYTDEALALLKKAEDAGIKIIKKDKYIKGMKSLGPRMPRKANVEALTRALQALKNGDPVRPVEYWVG